MTRHITFLALLASMLFVGQLKADSISEFAPNPPGADPATQEVELLGTPNTQFSLWILSIESDLGGSQGTVDRGEIVSGTYDADGLAVVTIADLENPSFTLILAEDFTGTVGTTDIDTDDDGTIDDASAIVGVMDAIGVLEDEGDPEYGAQLGGVDFTPNDSEPTLVFRDSTSGVLYAVFPFLDLVIDVSGEAVTGTFSSDPAVSTFGFINPSLGGGTPVLLGDANCNNVVDFGDIAPFIALLSSGEFKAEADINMSGTVDFADIAGFISILSGSGS